MQIKTPTIIDIYEGEYPVKIAEMNPLLTICRASVQFIGTRTRREDYHVVDYVNQCKAAGLKWGLYHFLTPNGIAEQAALFMGVWNKVGGASIAPVVDIEVDLQGSYGGTIGNAIWQSHIKTFMDLIASGTGKTPIIYTNKKYWEFVKTRNTLFQLVPPIWTADHPLWVAWYPNLPDSFVTPDSSVIPAGWTSWAMWQYTDDGRSSGYLANDLNIASTDFLFEIGDVTPPPPPPPPPTPTTWPDKITAYQDGQSKDYFPQA